MDAQNAAQSDQTKPAGASSPRSGPQPAAASSPAPVSPKRERDPQSATESSKPSKPSKSPAPEPQIDRDSDAETIVLPGKDGHSPSKARKVRQEDKSDGDSDKIPDKTLDKTRDKTLDKTLDKTPAPPLALPPNRPGDGVKKKRLPGHHLERDKLPRSKDGSSGLSSAPASPPRQGQQHRQHRRRSDDPRSSSDSEPTHHRPPKTTLRDKLKAGERLVSHKRKAPKPESDDEADIRKARRQRTTSSGIEPGRLHREHKSSSSSSSKPNHDNRSISPQARPHRRSASTQMSSQAANGLVPKKKRLPPPLQSTDYHSDESSTSGSPHLRHSKLRGLATSNTAESNVSPAKMAPHKKHLDAHGQTFLARACAKGEYEAAKQRLGERPEDLNVADYAGNTPLQIAAIHGCEDIVKLLIDAGCNLDCVNYDKDTPLLDAVDNGHLGVVKLLLGAGVNPRKANVNGEEPIDRVTEDTENAEEIRAALQDAKKRAGERRRTSEDRHSHDYHDNRDSHAPDSPRRSPAAIMSGSGRRSVTVRSTKTRNDLLYMPLDDKTLRQAAGRGDEETVARILQVKEGYDDPESMVAAARGGHDLVIQLLLGLGGANPDPAPAPSLPAEFATPILAAIGQENIKVIELLLEQQSFDPTRRFKGETYYEIARRRQGTNWKEEEHLLKNAYDDYKRSHKDTMKTKSPGRRERERERERDREDRDAKRTRRAEAKEETRVQKRSQFSPSREVEARKKNTSSKLTSPKEKRHSNPFATHTEDHLPKRGPGRPKKEDRLPSINVSDRELSPIMAHKQLKTKRTESDAAGVSSEGETVKPRRKLVSKGELRGEREKQRRASLASNASSLKEHPTSPHDSRHNDDTSDKHRSEKLSEKYHDRTKALKRDDSRDRLSVTGEGSAKRHRTSITPDRPSNGERDENEIPVKRRRLESETKEKRQKSTVSSDERPRKPNPSQDASAKASNKSNHRNPDDNRKESRHDLHRRDSGRSNGSDKSIHVKSEDVDIDMCDADVVKVVTESAEARAGHEKEAAEAQKRRLEQEEEQRKRDEAEEKKRLEAEQARKLEEEEKKRLEEERRERERKRQEEEEERKRREEEEKQKREAEEKERQAEEERRRAAEEKEERRKKQEEERKRREEEERKRREEEDRLHREQLEREAAEEARRQREEEERKERERERRERAHREELERKRAIREAEQKRIRDEQERARLDKLPPLLRWLDHCPNPQIPAIAEKFRHMQGARYDTLRPEANGTPEGREQWVLNAHVCLLLGEKDLDLSRYTAWERVPATELAKLTLWRVEWPLYSLIDKKLWDLGRQLPDYYGAGIDNPSELSLKQREALRTAAWNRFLKTNMFFVKVSDLMYTVSNVPHLRNLQLTVEYRELMETEAEKHTWSSKMKWKQDPDAAQHAPFQPGHRYYINGSMIGQEMPKKAQMSKEPFPEVRVPRRGLLRVYPEDPDYERICIEQGLEHLVKGHPSPSLVNGVHPSSPISQKSETPGRCGMNGNATNGAATSTNGGQINGVDGYESRSS